MFGFTRQKLWWHFFLSTLQTGELAGLCWLPSPVVWKEMVQDSHSWVQI